MTKKLYTEYPPGFRKGNGANDDIGLYKQLAIVLALAYVQNQNLQYLSTLLKVNDLLLSLPTDTWLRCSNYSIELAVAVELHAVLTLAQVKGVSLNAD